MGDLFAWIISFFSLAAIIFIVVYQIMCWGDLECDYINPYDSAHRINQLVFPEYIVGAALCLFFLLTGHWCMVLLFLPYLYYNVRLYTRREHLVDVTEIFNLSSREKKRRVFKLAYLIVLLFVSLFWILYVALEDSETD